MQNFIIKHALQGNLNIYSSNLENSSNTSTFSTTSAMFNNPFETELIAKLTNLSQFENSLSDLKKATSNLSNLKELDNDEISELIDAKLSNKKNNSYNKSFIENHVKSLLN